MNQYTVTFTIHAHDLASAEESATRIVRRLGRNYDANPLLVRELDPETHYGAVLAEAVSEQNNKIICPKCGYDTGHYDLRSQLEELIRPKALAYEQEQNSADDSLRSFDDALGQGRC